MTDSNKKEKFPSTFTVDNFSSTTKLADHEYKIPVGSVDTLAEKEYSPYEHRNVEHPNTFSGALMHLLKSSLGTGILAIPSAVAAAGIVIGVIGTVLTGILCTHTIHLLIFASQEICKKAKVPMLGFAETAHAVFKYGPKPVQPLANFARIFVDVALLLTYYAGNAVYIVFICGSVQDLVNYHYASVSHWPIQYYMLMLLVPLTLCCQVRQLKHLVPFSIIANVTMVTAFLITLYYMFSGISSIKIEERKLFKDVSLIPLFFSTVLFAMEGIGTMLPIENSMIKPQFIGCPGVLNVAMSFVVTLYTIIGLFGYIRFGDSVKANVIEELPNSDIAAQVAKLCIAIAVFFTFMLQFYVPCDITWRKLARKIPEKHHNVSQIVMRTILVCFVTGIAAAVPKLDAIIGLVGSVFFSTLGLFIPVVIDIILNLGENGDFGFMKWRLWKNIFVIVISWFALFSGSYYAIKGLLND
ncbi:Proton-coupled amino acid transporter 4-like Protein [Tribolium castaneum]|uniref:Proton-coupled amino acid transporter 4-like Protein n=1 Tax=Tribolium castaneum TaxID=7070 RepID=D2A0C4_TRICA|nr:PREDICTED: proton-coupled amino acid transporter 4 [Tribolium castaneum]EFA01717.1 Proton-coupled amino acid transporter 4-like Protein [Tribolium castaneum]|eukprot:XP_975607.1 PREDICTED: proton-coupled amino acid transporter 4 [Tribolium castaneum]